jgi:hypothetical protein
MELATERPTQVGLGYATHPDAFQCGREAAQIAKNQLPEARVDMVLVFGPCSLRFKDFIEGVRLVMGEETLIAIPSAHVMSSETSEINTSFVVALQSASMRLSIASNQSSDPTHSQGTTSLITQFRRSRGNAFREYTHRGSLVFSHHLPEKNNRISHNMAADMGL